MLNIIKKLFCKNFITDYRTVFIIGHSNDTNLEEKVIQEIKDKKDILFIDILDSYRNLTLKHMLAYEWAIEECPKAGTDSIRC